MELKLKHVVVLMIGLLALSACTEDDLEPSLAQEKNIDTSIKTAENLRTVLVGAYNRMSNYEYNGRNTIILGEIFSDNCTSIGSSNRFVDEAAMKTSPTSSITTEIWSMAYKAIAQTNIVINKGDEVTGDEDKVNQIVGQAYALRALIHFKLLKFYGQQNLYGGGDSSPGVPYITTFRNLDKLSPSRSTVGEVRKYIFEDLTKADSLMSDYLNGSNEYITTYAVDAIRARVALYFGEWTMALDAANDVINPNVFRIAEASEFIANFALDNTSNSIFELAYSGIDNPSIDGLTNIYRDGAYGDIIVLPNLVNIYDQTDVRGFGGVITNDGKYYRNTGKFPAYESNVSLIRYAEIILIKAEALYELNRPNEALIWLNKIPQKRNTFGYLKATKYTILLERRKELAFEGFRFHTLARTHQDIPAPDPVLQTHGGPAYGSYNYAMPIPASELNSNGNIKQNAGYY